MTRLQLILGPHRREYTCFPRELEPPARKPGIDFSNTLTPEERRQGANANRKPRAGRINFNCSCHPRPCVGHADIHDDRLAVSLRWRDLPRDPDARAGQQRGGPALTTLAALNWDSWGKSLKELAESLKGRGLPSVAVGERKPATGGLSCH